MVWNFVYDSIDQLLWHNENISIARKFVSDAEGKSILKQLQEMNFSCAAESNNNLQTILSDLCISSFATIFFWTHSTRHTNQMITWLKLPKNKVVHFISTKAVEEHS